MSGRGSNSPVQPERIFVRLTLWAGLLASPWFALLGAVSGESAYITLAGSAVIVVLLAWRQLANRHRKVRRGRSLVERIARTPNPAPETPESIVIRRETGAEVRSALSQLRRGDQEVLRLATWEELPHAEIAEILGCSRHAVDQRIHRATRRLARKLAKTGTGMDMETVAPARSGGLS